MNIANLKKRIIFVTWAIPLAWWIINSTFSFFSLLPESVYTSAFGGYKIALFPGHLLAIVLSYIACFEYIGMVSRLYPKNGFWMMYIWLGLQVFSYFIPENILTWKNDLYILLIIVALEAFIWGKNTGRWKRASLIFSGTIFISLACSSMLDYYDIPFQTVFASSYKNPMLSQMGIVTIITAIFMCDSVAFFAGSLFGKHKLSSISPKKTIEGSIAGLIASVIVTVIGWHFFVADKYPLVFGIIMGVLVGVFAQVGDLLVSLMKRYFNVKDASNIIPGHGGILDRFDSLFFASPIVNLFIITVFKLIK